jgi:hypothetical protein
MKILPVAAELFHTHGQTDQTDMMKLIIALRIFTKAPKNSHFFLKDITIHPSRTYT